MITVVSGTNRPASFTMKVARLVERCLVEAGCGVRLLDLGELPSALFEPSSYGQKPAAFEPFQTAMLDASGVVMVVPEYNGSFPGILKYFIDMLDFPQSLLGMPAAFVGLASGRWGALRAVEQLELVFQYRGAHLFGRRLFLPGIREAFDNQGCLADRNLAVRLHELVLAFTDFCDRLRVAERV